MNRLIVSFCLPWPLPIDRYFQAVQNEVGLTEPGKLLEHSVLWVFQDF